MLAKFPVWEYHSIQLGFSLQLNSNTKKDFRFAKIESPFCVHGAIISQPLTFSLIPSLFERYISIGCADLIWDITLARLDQAQPFLPRDDPFDLSQKLFLLCPHLHQLIAECGNRHLLIHNAIISHPAVPGTFCAVLPYIFPPAAGLFFEP